MIVNVLILFIAISLIAIFSPKENSKLSLFFFIGIGVVLFITAIVRDGENVADYDTYKLIYDTVKNGDSLLLVEPSFLLISHISSAAWMMFVIYAFLGIYFKLTAIRELTQLWFLSLVIYFANLFVLQEMTQIRAGVAAGLLLMCIKPIYDRNWKFFLLYSGLAVCFHYSALIILPFWFFDNKPRRLLLALSIPFAYAIYFSGINLIVALPIPAVQEKLKAYDELIKLGGEEWTTINVFNSILLIKIAIFYLYLWKYSFLVEKNKYLPILLKIQALTIMSFSVFAIMPVIGFRINELLGAVEIITLPFLYYLFKPKILSALIVVTLGGIMLYVSVFLTQLIK